MTQFYCNNSSADFSNTYFLQFCMLSLKALPMVKLLIFYSKIINKLTEMSFSWIEIVIDSLSFTMNHVTFLIYYITTDPF